MSDGTLLIYDRASGRIHGATPMNFQTRKTCAEMARHAGPAYEVLWTEQTVPVKTLECDRIELAADGTFSVVQEDEEAAYREDAARAALLKPELLTLLRERLVLVEA